MASSKISFSYEAIGSQILRAPWMVEHMRGRAQRMLIAAWDRAPVYTGDGRDDHRGRYRASLRVETTDRGGFRHDRAAGVVIADSPEAVFVEYGRREFTQVIRSRDGKERTVTIPAMAGQHVLGSAMMAAAGDE